VNPIAAWKMEQTMTTDLRIAQAQLEQARAELEAAIQHAGGGDFPVKEEKKPPGTARCVETMFRSVYRVQMDLTGLADNKANMMISINGIIISIVLASVAPKLDANPWLLLPTTILLIGNMVSMIFAILAARPRVSHNPGQPGESMEVAPRGGNILFFGTFANLSEDRFVQRMQAMMADKDNVYDSMIRNIHGLGSVLFRKFVLLRYAYSSFMVALVLGVTAFLAVFGWLSQRTL